MIRLLWPVFTLIFLSVVSLCDAQQLRGTILDRQDNSAQIGVGVFLISTKDTTQKKGTATDLEGNFSFNHIPAGSYLIRTSYLGYKTTELPVILRDSSVSDIGAIYIEQMAIEVKTVTVEGRQLRTVQKGDTTEHNAGAFKTNPDATAEDLVTKMPGITVESGTVKAQGETVQKVLIDGKEFFGEDASIALKNLPADVVDKVQVFDRMSDQAQLTGFDDGNNQKTINIVTKANSSGRFGKIYGGYGTDDRYTGGLNLNSFKGSRKISVIGLSNNINQQNFSSQDLIGLSGSQGGGGGGRQGSGGTNAGMSGSGRGQGNAGNFLVGQQSGISTTNSAGVNYADSWGKKINVTGSYFFNNSWNQNRSIKDRTYFLNRSFTQKYGENTEAGTDNYNHRFTGRLEYNIDTANSIIFTPRINLQQNSSGSFLTGRTSLSDSIIQSTLNSNNNYQYLAYNLAGNLLFRHRFARKGRTITLGFNANRNNSSGNRNQLSENRFFIPDDSISIVDQEINSKAYENTLSPSVVYTEPVSKTSIVSVNYSPSFNLNSSDRKTFIRDSSGNYSVPNLILSNIFNNNVQTHKGGAGFRTGNRKVRFNADLNIQQVQLKGNQEYPVIHSVGKTFNNILPSLMFSYKISGSRNLRLYYRTSTQVPSVTQLQNVLNNANPLLLTTGNPDLRQEYTHSLSGRYGSANAENGTSFNTFANFSYANSYIGSSTLIATENIPLRTDVTLNSGSQLTKPVNLDGFINFAGFMTYGLPVTFVRSNLNLNGGYIFNKTPGLINERLNEAYTHTMSGAVTLGSNISPSVDFTLSYSGNYNIIKNTSRPSSNSNYFNHTASLKTNWITWKGIFIGSELINVLYEGLGTGFNRNFFLWNPHAGIKFLKNKSAEFRVSVFDMLKQNNSISRAVTGAYYEDNQTLVLKRYFMFTLTYTIRSSSSSGK